MEKSKLIKDYEIAVNAIATAFINKQNDMPDEPPLKIDGMDWYWAGDDVGGVLCGGDTYYYSFKDILEDMEENAPVGEIVKYYDYCERCSWLKLKTINYHSWLHGCPRHSEETLKHLEELRQQISDEVERLNKEGYK